MDVVCGTDLSAAALEAAEIAGALAARSKGRLILVMALELPAVTYVAGDVLIFDTPPKATDEAKARANERLTEEAKRIRALTGCAVVEQLDIGGADRVLVDAARRENAGLVVVGSHGHRIPIRWLLGSTAERLTATSPVPVLVTRGSSAPLLAWAKEARPLRVLIAADFEETFAPAARFANRLFEGESVEVHVAHACDLPIGDLGRYPYAPTLPIRRVDLETNASVELRRHVESSGLRTRSDALHLVWGKPAAAIATFAKEGRFDIVVAGTHSRHGLERALLGSVAHGLLRRCASPVLVVPPPQK